MDEVREEEDERWKEDARGAGAGTKEVGDGRVARRVRAKARRKRAHIREREPLSRARVEEGGWVRREGG